MNSPLTGKIGSLVSFTPTHKRMCLYLKAVLRKLYNLIPFMVFYYECPPKKTLLKGGLGKSGEGQMVKTLMKQSSIQNNEYFL